MWIGVAGGRLLYAITPEEEQSGLFTEFFRASNAKELARIGTGLGLAIVRGIVEAHKGAIWVQSHPGEGTIFSFSLPCGSDGTAEI